MEKFVIKGGTPLKGNVKVGGAKNVVLKVLVAACLTPEPVVIHNVPQISDVNTMIEIMQDLGGEVTIDGSTVTVQMKAFAKHIISLDQAAHIKTSSMFLAPLLGREKEATIPNPGGCRLGARPINRHIEGLEKMGAHINYESTDGYFHATTDGLKGATYRFDKNTHTGTETLIIAAALATGVTRIENAAEEPEIDELIALLNAMGGQVKRTESRVIEITGVEKLHGAECTIQADRNEIVTFAIAALVTKGDIFVEGVNTKGIEEFLALLGQIGGGVEIKDTGIRFFYKGPIKATDVVTNPYPAFMTDWQSPWAVLMTQAEGVSTIHETIFENKFGYVHELRKMGAKIELYNPEVADREATYNFNLEDDQPGYFHAIRITGPSTLHNAIVTMLDLRAGAAVVIAALAAKGESMVHGIRHIDRGYEHFEERLVSLGAMIERKRED
jgi:UDP-N-acetylglucosamine 1-carboxyvinyltransferase